MLGVGVIEDGDAVAVCDLDDFAGKGIGEGCGGCQQQERQHSQNGRFIVILRAFQAGPAAISSPYTKR